MDSTWGDSRLAEQHLPTGHCLRILVALADSCPVPMQSPAEAHLPPRALSQSWLGAVAGCVVSDQLEGIQGGLSYLDMGMAAGITLYLLAASAESLRLAGEVGLSPPV